MALHSKKDVLIQIKMLESGLKCIPYQQSDRIDMVEDEIEDLYEIFDSMQPGQWADIDYDLENVKIFKFFEN